MGEIYENWKRANVLLINKNKDPGIYRVVSLTAVPGEDDEITNS